MEGEYSLSLFEIYFRIDFYLSYALNIMSNSNLLKLFLKTFSKNYFLNEENKIGQFKRNFKRPLK